MLQKCEGIHVGTCLITFDKLRAGAVAGNSQYSLDRLTVVGTHWTFPKEEPSVSLAFTLPIVRREALKGTL